MIGNKIFQLITNFVTCAGKTSTDLTTQPSSRKIPSSSYYFIVFLTTSFMITLFNSSFFTIEPNNRYGLIKLDVRYSHNLGQDLSATTANAQAKLPARWFDLDKTGKHTRIYEATIPAQQLSTADTILISGYRQHLKVRWKNHTVLETTPPTVMSRNQLNPPQILTLNWPGLNPNADINLTISVTNGLVNDGFLGQIYLGTRETIQDSLPFMVRTFQSSLLLSFGMLMSAFFLLLISSRGNREKLVQTALILPHLTLVYLESSHYIDGPALILTKLYSVSLIMSVYTWCYIAHKLLALDLYRIRIRLLIWPIILSLLPAMLQTTPEGTVFWTTVLAEPTAALVGMYVFFSYSIKVGNKVITKPQIVLTIFACLLLSSGIADNLNYWSEVGSEQIKAFPVVASQLALFRFIYLAFEVAKHTQELEKEKLGIEKLARQQACQLEEVRSQLLRFERLRLLNALGASISHEVRNPLATLSANLTLAEKHMEPHSPLLLSVYARMRRSVYRIESIVQKLLNFAKHRHTLDTDLVDLSNWIISKMGEEQLKQAAMQSAISFQNSAPGLAQVEIDSEMIVSALCNMVQNAADANAETGGEEIIIKLNADHSHFLISVLDYGPGVRFQFDANNLQPFISTKSQGLGMGLLIIHDIAVLHNGVFTLKDRENNRPGAVATLKIPLPYPLV